MSRREDIKQIRAIACIAIVILHTFRSFITSNMEGYAIACIIRDLMNFAVPCFLMVSGFLLLDKNREITIKKVWTKYIPSVLIPLIFCTVLFSVTDSLIKGTELTGVLKDSIVDLWTDGSWKHLWYVYMLIGIYILLPFYRKIAASSTNTEIIYLIWIWIIFLSIIPQTSLLGVKSGFYVCTYTVYPLFLFIGIAQGIKRPWLIFTISAFITALSSYAAYGIENGTIQKMISTYTFLPVILMATGFFHGWIGTNFSSKFFLILSRIDDCGFGIYLYHVLFIRLLALVYRPVTIPAIFCTSLLILCISWAFVFLVQKTPVFKHICC